MTQQQIEGNMCLNPGVLNRKIRSPRVLKDRSNTTRKLYTRKINKNKK